MNARRPPAPYRILVTGSRDWDGEQELRIALIAAWTPHQETAVIVLGESLSDPEAMAAEWASHYGVRTERPGEAAPDVVLVFGDDPDPARAAGVKVRHHPQLRRPVP